MKDLLITALLPGAVISSEASLAFNAYETIILIIGRHPDFYGYNMQFVKTSAVAEKIRDPIIRGEIQKNAQLRQHAIRAEWEKL